jgi:hypothetical protein
VSNTVLWANLRFGGERRTAISGSMKFIVPKTVLCGAVDVLALLDALRGGVEKTTLYLPKSTSVLARDLYRS